MDGYREHPNDFDLPLPDEAPAAHDIAAAIGTDERRMHVRAYNYWVSLLDGRDFPSIEDLEPGDVTDFSGHSVLLDFTCGREHPAIPYIGAEIRDECGLDDDVRTIADVPSRSLLSRLTDHYMQIIANRAPIGFEAEFANPRGVTICYRGILMPFSSDGDTIDFIYGVINWKSVGADGDAAPQAGLPTAAEAVADPLEAEAVVEDPVELTEATVPFEEPLELTDSMVPFEQPLDHTESTVPFEEPLDLTEIVEQQPIAEAAEVPFTQPEAEQPAEIHAAWEDGPLHDPVDVELVDLSEIGTDLDLPADAALADRLWAARELAETVKAGEGRSRAALYRALSLAYDFAVTARENPQDYAELLEESGVKAQARAPMTPVVKLVFGIDYDKARLTEFAAALSFGLRQGVELGSFEVFIDKQAGGLKALVAAERQARRPEPRPDTRGDAARARLRASAPISLADLGASGEFAVVVTRRRPDGSHVPVALVEDEALVERAIRKAA